MAAHQEHRKKITGKWKRVLRKREGFEGRRGGLGETSRLRESIVHWNTKSLSGEANVVAGDLSAKKRREEKTREKRTQFVGVPR